MLCKRNERPNGEMTIYIASFQKSLKDNYDSMLFGNGDTIPIQMAPDQFAKYIAPDHCARENLGAVSSLDPKSSSSDCRVP